jgi:DNA-binding transcriptional regulator YhcF (GntR family)
MNKLQIINLIRVDEYSITPKYLQIANSVVREIENGQIKVGENIPSINELSEKLNISRDTVERAYKHLKQIGVIEAVARRCYYIKSIEFRKPLKLFLLPNKLSAPKKAIYDSFIAALGDHAVIDFCIYNNDFSLFKKLIAEKKDDYTHCVLVPHFVKSKENVNEIIDVLPKEKLGRLK